MTPEKIISVIEMYEARLQAYGVAKKRMDPRLTFKKLTSAQLLEHAYYLCDGAKEYARDLTRQRKAGSHLTAIQMCLSFAGWYTLQDLMNHNKPD